MPGGEEFCREETARNFPMMNDTFGDSIYGITGNIYDGSDYQMDPNEIDQTIDSDSTDSDSTTEDSDSTSESIDDNAASNYESMMYN